MRLIGIALLLAATPALAGGARVALPKVVGPDAPWFNYSSVPVAGMRPMTQAEVVGVLKLKRSYPEQSRVPVWHQRNGASRSLSFVARGTKVSDGGCDPVACPGRYTISGNVVTIDFKPRQGVMKLSFFVTPDGVAMVVDDWGPQDGRVSPW